MAKTKPDKLKARARYLKQRYNMTLEDYDRMLVEQDHACAICHKHESLCKTRLAVDHNHKTGVTRGLLCFFCNHRLVGRHTLVTAIKLYNYMVKYEGNK